MSTPPPPPPSGPPPPPAAPPPPPGGYYSPQPGAPGGTTLARPWMRILARFLDGIIMGIITNLLVAAFVLDSGDSAGFGGLGRDYDAGQYVAVTLIGVAVSFLYEAVLTALKGGTPMKLAFGMRVVRVGGEPVDWRSSIIRWAVFGLLPVLPIIGAIAGFVMAIVSLIFLFTDKLRQTVPDKAATTIVVSVR